MPNFKIYKLIASQRTDGMWQGTFPGLSDFEPVVAPSRRKVEALAWEALLFYLYEHIENSPSERKQTRDGLYSLESKNNVMPKYKSFPSGSRVPKDTSKLKIFKVDTDRLNRYQVPEEDPREESLR